MAGNTILRASRFSWPEVVPQSQRGPHLGRSNQPDKQQHIGVRHGIPYTPYTYQARCNRIPQILLHSPRLHLPQLHTA